MTLRPRSKPKSVTVPPCDLCKKVQTKLGAIMQGPPRKDGYSKKRNVCVGCYREILRWFQYR